MCVCVCVCLRGTQLASVLNASDCARLFICRHILSTFGASGSILRHTICCMGYLLSYLVCARTTRTARSSSRAHRTRGCACALCNTGYSPSHVYQRVCLSLPVSSTPLLQIWWPLHTGHVTLYILFINFRITIRKLSWFVKSVSVCMYVCIWPLLWSHFSMDLDETLELNLEYYFH
jgi:hypothetical protein